MMVQGASGQKIQGTRWQVGTGAGERRSCPMHGRHAVVPLSAPVTDLRQGWHRIVTIVT